VKSESAEIADRGVPMEVDRGVPNIDMRRGEHAFPRGSNFISKKKGTTS